MAALIGLVVGALIGGLAGGREGASVGGLIGFVIGVVIAIRRERRTAQEPALAASGSVATSVDAALAQRVAVLERRVADLENTLRARSAIAAGASADAASIRTVPVAAPAADRATALPGPPEAPIPESPIAFETADAASGALNPDGTRASA